MENINLSIICGNLARDSELSYTAGGTAVLKYAVAVNRSVKGKNGEYADEASFIEVVHFGKAAEALKEYLAKGTKVCVQGSLRQDRWKDSDGLSHSKVYIVASQIEFMSRGQGSHSNAGEGGYVNDDEIQF